MRCQYTHDSFKHSGAFNPFSLDKKHNASNQCWMDGDDVTEWKLPDGTKKAYCLFHAPQDGAQTHQWSKTTIGKAQSQRLKELLNEWNIENRTRADNSKLTFVLPRLLCGDIDLSGQDLSSAIDLTGAIFDGVTRFEHTIFRGSARFDKASFNGQVWFGDATFCGDAGFRQTRFGGIAWFGSTAFNAYARFDGAVFAGKSWFGDANFEGQAWFEETIFTSIATFSDSCFLKEAFFKKTEFKENALFSRAKFGGISRFETARFLKSAYFTGAAQFAGAVNFDYAQFGENANTDDEVNFDSATFHNNLSFENAKFNAKLLFTLVDLKKGGRFTKCRFYSLEYKTHIGEKLLFNSCTTEISLDFSDQDCSRLAFLNMSLDRANFLGARIAGTSFEACRWGQLESGPKYAAVYGHDDILGKNDDERLLKLKSLYRQLMKNLEESRDHKQAGDFHYRDMELRQKLIEAKISAPESSLELSILKLYRLVGDYGENYIKLGITMIGSLLTTTAIVFLTDTHGAGEQGLGDRLKAFARTVEYVLYGMVPSSLQRTVDIPLGELSWLSQFAIFIETFVALILVTLFAMAVSRRFRR